MQIPISRECPGDAISLMGSLLGPVLVDLFMGYYEKIWLEEFKTCEVV